MKPVYDAIVVGGGLVGSALAFGLQRQGLTTLILDEGDIAIRATRGNFGLIWVQSKGINFSPYAQWTWKSAELWKELSAQLYELTNIDIGYRRPGGAEVCCRVSVLTLLGGAIRRAMATPTHWIFYVACIKAFKVWAERLKVEIRYLVLNIKNHHSL
jgi:glycine/D-amino acid oxidase-like deaminating enzyme